jgi:DUF1680 family protein
MKAGILIKGLGMGIFAFILIAILNGCEKKKAVSGADEKMKPIPFTDVKISDEFWSRRIETNRKVTIPAAFKKCEETGRIDNFAIAGGLKEGEHKGVYPFDDTDVYKIIEGASYPLSVQPDPTLDNYVDGIIKLIAAAQEDDGYLHTARTNKSETLKWRLGDERWVNLRGHSHELYNMGHLYEAAAAHFYATGKRNLLDIAIKNAELLCEVFGPGKNETAPGHQEIELGLVKLYEATGQEKYLQLAKFFLDKRGPGGEEYSQTHKRVVDQDEAVGHAVRAGYMYSAMADIAALTSDRNYTRALDQLWNNVVGKKLYVTGGLGSDPSIEGFGPNYDLPNMSAYCETCASIANVFWNQRMFLLHADAKYIDVLERTLYNALISGVSMDGSLFFYPNALASRGQHARSEWFVCACCPGNITRFMASLPGYVYAKRGNEFYVNLFVTSETTVELGGRKVQIKQLTNYPWDGKVRIMLEPEGSATFTMCIRIPCWSRNKPLPSDLYRFMQANDEQVTLKVNGVPVAFDMDKGYARIDLRWEKGDVIEFNLPMPVRRLLANEKVEENKGRVALQRGPIVYCVEAPDVEDGRVLNLLLEDNTNLEAEFKPELLNGITTIKGIAKAYRIEETNDVDTLVKEDENFFAIPYYAWSHRGPAEMAVWLARKETAVEPAGIPSIAETSTVTASEKGIGIEAVNDGLIPSGSSDISFPVFTFLPRKGSTEWLQYDFGKTYEPSIVEVYWLEDDENRLPESWKIQYRKGNEWEDVWTPHGFSLEKDKLNTVIFETVKTDALRLELQMQPGFSAGIFEWRVK